MRMYVPLFILFKPNDFLLIRKNFVAFQFCIIHFTLGWDSGTAKTELIAIVNTNIAEYAMSPISIENARIILIIPVTLCN